MSQLDMTVSRQRKLKGDHAQPQGDEVKITRHQLQLRPQTDRQAQEANGHATIDREEQIAKAAYCRAEARGFEPGHELEDWLAAEAEVNARLQAQ